MGCGETDTEYSAGLCYTAKTMHPYRFLYTIFAEQGAERFLYIYSLLLFTSVFNFSRTLFSQMAKCDGCKRQGKLSESMKWQGEIKHFCNLLCILLFCNQQSVSDPPPPNNTGKPGWE